MRLHLSLFLMLSLCSVLIAQDDIYDAPERVKPRVVYSNDNLNNPNRNGDGSYENIDESFNPDYDYRYRRSLRRMYDPYYVMPSSAFLNMYTYPQFANFYNPYWGWNSGFSITIGNAWGSPWGWNNWGMGWNSWNNPWGWNSWNSWYAWNNPWGWNNWGGGWNSWNNPWCGWNSWGGGWYDPYWGGGWNGGWNGRGNNWSSGQRNSVTPPERRISRAVRVMDPNRDYGNTTYRPSQPQGNSGWNNGGSNSPTYRSTPSNNAPSQGTMTPTPSRMGGNTPSSGGGGSSGSSGGGRSGGRSGGSSRF